MSQHPSVSKANCRTFAKAKVNLPSGLTVAMTLDEPSADWDPSNGNNLAVLLHPWSWLGGSMSDPVLLFLCDILKAKGFYTIRYNSRGVGGSSGWRSFSGLQEGLDLQEVVQWALSQVSDVRHVLLVGYSHGSFVAAQHPVLPNPTRTSHILLSYPLDKRALLTFFHSNAHAIALKTLVQSDRSNILIISGDHDEFTTGESYKNWMGEIRAYPGNSRRLEAQLVPGATHFWRDNDADQLQQIVAEWLDKSLSDTR